MENKIYTPEKLRQGILSGLVIAALGVISLLVYQAGVSEQQRIIAQCGPKLEQCERQLVFVPHFDGSMSVDARYVTPTPIVEDIP